MRFAFLRYEMVASKHPGCRSLVKPRFRILGSTVGGWYLFSSSFEYASFLVKCRVEVGASGINLLAGVAVFRRDDFQLNGIYEAIVYCKRALHTRVFLKFC